MADILGSKLVHRNHRPVQPGLRSTVPRVRRCRARPRGGSTGQAYGWLETGFRGLAARRSGCTSPRRSGSPSTASPAKQGSLRLAKVTGIVVHDHWKPLLHDDRCAACTLCNAHHLQELKALVEIEKKDWARQMQRLLRRESLPRDEPCARAGCAADAGPDRTDRAQLRRDPRGRSGVPHEGTARAGKAGRRGRPPRRVGHNLLLRLSTYKSDVLPLPERSRCAAFTNNLAEQDGRMMKLRRRKSPAASAPRMVRRILPTSVQCSRRPESRVGICSGP